MATQSYTGSPQFPAITSSQQSSSVEEMEQAIATLQSHKEVWVHIPVAERITLVETLIADFSTIVPHWVEAGATAKKLDRQSLYASEEYITGTWPILRMLRQLRSGLMDIQRYGQPRIPKVTTRPDGQVVARVFPYTVYDRLFLNGVSAEVWMQPGITAEQIASTQAVHYKETGTARGKVSLVLSAGNVASIGPMDILTKLFIDNEVVLLKANPVNAYLGPLLAQAFRALIDRDVLRIAYGGTEEGAFLCSHPGIDTIHITGSDKTFEAIVFGGGSEGAAHKAAHQPQLQKPISGELGNVSPVIIVPGPWSISDIAYHAEHIASSIMNNAGFNCNASRVIIQHEGWSLRRPLLQQLHRVLANQPARPAYYPGAQQRYALFLSEHPDAEQFGKISSEDLPWTLISNVDPAKSNDICFTTEAFCSLCAETALPATDVVEYIERAVDFANDTLWGTLNATIIVHPQSLKDPAIAAAIDRALARLRYGTIGLNYWAGIGFVLGETTWGAFPGHDIYDIQSGVGVVHNTLMFDQPQKSVLRGPFRSVPKPPVFPSQAGAARKLYPKLVDFEARPNIMKLPGIIRAAFGG